MLAATAKAANSSSKIMSMGTYINDSTGARIAWARKQKKWTGHDLARAVGVRNVYISQIENNHRRPALPMMRKLADALGVTVGFLLMETTEPGPTQPAEQEPVYFSPEADEAAQLIDAAPPGERARMLAVLRAMAVQEQPLPERNEFARRLVQSEAAPMRRLIRA